ncbi:SpoIIIAH-like family protein [Bacillus sp. CGMCC 1.16607]|uniref:SpoIIIAH-like family protein n=1 Tax=Bacillus sp. CGMCC 1.16607 TaxID=3351842 RepID=UPI00363BDA28
MLLKKQTVWLLTMLSLVVVLSVYYITSPEQKISDLASVEKKQEKGNEKDVVSSGKELNITSGIASDEVFESLRMDQEDARSQRKEELETIIASTELPKDQINDAVVEMKEINEVADKERMLETLIKTLGYDDALVRADGEDIRITVKAKEKSQKAANDILRLVRDEIGSMEFVVVDFQIEK